MMNIKNIFAAFVILFASTAYANDYDVNYYEDEGGLLFKVRGFYLSTPAKPKNLPEPAAGTEKPGALAQNGYGFDTSTTFFFAPSFATELSLGLGMIKVKSSTLKQAAAAYGDDESDGGKNNNIMFVPLTATIQYHVAPFGAIRPYVGGGYCGAYMYTRSKSYKVDTATGPVLQIGVDFIAKDDTFFTLDVRQYFLNSKVTFKKNLLSPTGAAGFSDVSSKVDWNPLVISAGFGFKF